MSSPGLKFRNACMFLHFKKLRLDFNYLVLSHNIAKLLPAYVKYILNDTIDWENHADARLLIVFNSKIRSKILVPASLRPPRSALAVINIVKNCSPAKCCGIWSDCSLHFLKETFSCTDLKEMSEYSSIYNHFLHSPTLCKLCV